MNIYFLLEGRRTEMKVYPKWIKILIPRLTRIATDPYTYRDNNPAFDNTFYLLNGDGFPSLLNNHLVNAVEDVNKIGRFDYLVICLDSDEDTVAERKQQVLDFIAKKKLVLNNGTIEIIVQNRCFETWMLGNKKACCQTPRNPEFAKYVKHYNVRTDDPELMPAICNSQDTAQFHAGYLTLMLQEKNISYSKTHPRGVVEEHYLQELMKRETDTKHISSFKTFVDFCQNINRQLDTIQTITS